MRHDDIYVAGRWVQAHSQQRHDVINPATEEFIASVPDADVQDVDAAVDAARAALPAWRSLNAEERAAALERLADEISRRSEDLTRLITTENGTPVSESSGAPKHAAAHLRVTAELASLLSGLDDRPNPMAPGHSVVKRVPVGVAALITPWNFPLGLVIIKLAPALLAGCTVVIKPAPETPLATRLLMECVGAAGIPDGVVNLVTGGVETGQALVEHAGVDKVSFTGSTAAGRSIGASCGHQLKAVTLELGGKSPAIVLDDADPSVIEQHLLKVAMRNTGQTCKACTRLLVPSSRYDEYVDLAADVISGAKLGDPFDPDTFFGPLVSARQRTRVLDYYEIAAAEGAKAVIGGRAATGFAKGYYVEPTVFRDVDNGMRIAQEEIFGPALAVIPYRDVDDAVAIANDSPYGLAATVFSSDLDRATGVADRLSTGNVGINHYGSNAAAPFGGHKDSGLGTEFGAEGLEAYLTYTSIHYQA
ncbi:MULTISPECIES: aldehyde dehydrogenase family protein [unclassified Nocardioides]|uniref:aldehyde dehydrogenase family protein n=1 Tax=unclassified Nocardioides TaxID=2615069 RepID=UPI0006F61B0A|nr:MULTISPECIES: aldehyde dehydrogenase family protein [unclassified Nocardioides]KQY50876.1 aldehyde dehydrogenase [Nocardioides sp. Root140]KQZ75634.1 aldehyde dehydrogenase [Nocardioides sp. Root151]KRF14702.1 aldehyde dehydrogenase [Nocardioides sp. Soil796]